MRTLAASALCLGISLLIADNARSNETISTPLQDFWSPWGPSNLDNPNAWAYGQSFTVPAGATELIDFTFSYLTTNNNQGFEFVATLYAFDPVGRWALGSPLWTSSVQTISSTQAPIGNPTPYSFSPDVAMTEGQTYLMIVTSGGITQTPPADTGVARMGISDTSSYAGGALYYRSSVSPANPTNGPWTQGPSNFDAAFIATFAVPEPSVLGLAAAGVIFGAGFWRARRRA